ncbi:MAG: pyruvate, water dikinase regulatory protein [Bacillota bacterium]
MKNTYQIYIISDSIGDTAEQVARAAAEQFRKSDYEIKKYPYVESRESIDEIIDEAKNKNSIVIFTMVDNDIYEYLKNVCAREGLPYIDIMTPALEIFSEFLESKPARQPGLIRELDENYFKRVEAVEFAVKYDDGKDPRGILKADIVLIGVSRSSKTPLSMYLAHKNYKVVNIPLVKDAKLPDEIFQIPRRKIIGLTIDPVDLIEIRKERIKVLGLDNSVDYVSLEKIMEELTYAEQVMKRVGCPVIDMTKKAVEEAANIIIDIINGLN